MKEGPAPFLSFLAPVAAAPVAFGVLQAALTSYAPSSPETRDPYFKFGKFYLTAVFCYFVFSTTSGSRSGRGV